MEPNLKQKISPHHAGKVEGWHNSAKSPKQYAPPYLWDGWGTADWVAEGSPLLKAVEEAVTLCIPGVGQWPSPDCTYAFMGKL